MATDGTAITNSRKPNRRFRPKTVAEVHITAFDNAQAEHLRVDGADLMLQHPTADDQIDPTANALRG
jgi:hypothetical protein